MTGSFRYSTHGLLKVCVCYDPIVEPIHLIHSSYRCWPRSSTISFMWQFIGHCAIWCTRSSTPTKVAHKSPTLRSRDRKRYANNCWLGGWKLPYLTARDGCWAAALSNSPSLTHRTGPTTLGEAIMKSMESQIKNMHDWLHKDEFNSNVSPANNASPVLGEPWESAIWIDYH